MTPEDRRNPSLAQHGAAMDRLLAMPRYWRGQAGMARGCAEEAHRRGDWRTADRLYGRALCYEARAEALTVQRTSPAAREGNASPPGD